MDERRALERSRRLSIPEALARSARRVPDRLALVFEGRRLTFAELDARTSRLAAALDARGVRPGDRVAILMHNRLEFVEAFLGIQKLGACAVPINFRLVPAEVAYLLDRSQAVGVIADREVPELDDAGFALRVGDEYEAALERAPAAAPDVVVDDEDLAFLLYTSGTTGRPKGAMLTHQNLLVNTTNWIHEVGATRSDVWLSGLPLFHIGGINGVLPFLVLGAPSVITASTGFDAGHAIGLLARHAVTMCYFVPTQWQDICTRPEVEDFDTSRLRVALWGASSAPRSTLELLTRTFPGVQVVNAFGQTEMSSNTAYLKGADAVRKMGSIGRPSINVEVRIVDDEGRDVPRGEVGEIVYRGPTVMRGYFGDPAATDAAFEGGWFHSGDLVREDEEGFLYVVDRKKDMIISGGENVYPAEVERVLLEHEAVAEVAVVGVPHPRWVETPLAVVVPAAGRIATAEELIEHCRTRLASYKKPSGVVFVESLPRNASGKVLKRDLRAAYGERFRTAPPGQATAARTPGR